MAITTRETTATGVTNKGAPLTNAEVDTNFIELQQNKVELDDLSVGAEGEASGDGSIAYDNTTGVFTYTPPADITGAVTFAAKAGEALTKGDVVYVSGVSGNTPVVSKADADDASKMPAFGLAEADASLNADVNVVTFGTLYNLDTSSFTAGDTVYVSTTAGGITATKPSGESSLIQNIGKVIRSHASAGSIKVGGAGRTNDVPNLADGNVFIGNASNQAEARSLTGDDISGGTITSFASTGIDDNASGTVMTIALSGETTFTGDVVISESTPSIKLDDADNADGELQIVQSSGSSFYRTRGVTANGAHVFQRTDGTTNLKIFQTNTSGDVIFYDDDGSTEGMRWDASSNRLGIGEVAPDEELHIKASNPTIKLEDEDGTDQHFRIFENNGQASLIAQNGTSFGNTIFRRNDGTNIYSILNLTADGDVIFYEDDGATSGLTWDASASKLTNFTSTGIDDNATSRVVTLSSQGKITIDPAGSTQGTHELSVREAASPRITIDNINGSDTDINAALLFRAGTTNKATIGFTGTDDFHIENKTAAGQLIFDTANSEAMRIDSSGNLLVGETSSGSSRFVAKKTVATGVYTAKIIDANTTAGNCFGINIDYSSATPNGSGNQFIYCEDSSALRMSVTSNGGISNYQAFDSNLSDQRAKKDIVESGNYLEKLCSIPVKNFRYNEDAEDSKHHLGVIAQDVEAVAPEFVNKAAWDYKGEKLDTVYNNDVMFAMLKAIQELSAQVTELKAEVAALKGAN